MKKCNHNVFKKIKESEEQIKIKKQTKIKNNPYQLPSSVEVVTNEKEGMLYDSNDSLYPFGRRLSYISLLGEQVR